MKTMKRGVVFRGMKGTKDKPISVQKIPKQLVIPLKQHIGSEAKPVVRVGDYVKKYQKIGEAQGGCSSNVHASSSGSVVGVEEREVAGGRGQCVVIETDGKDTAFQAASKHSLIDTVRSAGIVGMGGAGFPTHVKLKPKQNCDTFILNGCECEPHLTADLRLMVENPYEVVHGFRKLMSGAGIKKGIIGVEEKAAYESLLKPCKKEKNIEVKLLKSRYPQGAEKMLIYSLTGRKVPCGCIPAEVGVIVNNVATAKAVYDATKDSVPLVQRIVTVSGEGVKNRNLLVRIGTKFSDILQEEHEKVISGGPMMGIAVATPDVPVTKTTAGITVLSEKKEGHENCIRCGSCVDVCPMNLLPAKLANLASLGYYEKASEYYLSDCFECGCCAYVCPSRIPIVQLIKTAKMELKK